MEKLNTVDSILEYLAKAAAEKIPMSPSMYMDAVEKINALLQGEQEALFLEEQVVALMRRELLSEGKTAAYTKMFVEGSEEYLKVRNRKAKIDRAIETIRLGKIHARMASDVAKGQW